MTADKYQPGQRVQLVDAEPGYVGFGLAAGASGVVQFTDGLGTVHIRWDGGQRIGIIESDTWLLSATDVAEQARLWR